MHEFMKGATSASKRSLSFSDSIVNSLPQAIQKGLPADIAVVEVSEKESWRLNRAYRGKDKPADVLSFRYDPEYGEIIICPGVIRREAKIQKHSFEYQLAWMIVHGIIHLAGLHHEASIVSARRAERIEQRILDKLFKESRSKD